MGEGHPVGYAVGFDGARIPSRAEYRSGRYVTLRAVDPVADAEPFWRAAHEADPSGERVWTYMSYGPFPDVRAMREWLEGVSASDDPLFLTVVGSADGPIGMASFMSFDVAMGRIELGNIWFAPRAQGTEANTETAYLMLREAFDELGYRRVEWKCDALNERSRAAALRLGFAFEGVFRQHMVVKGRNRDTAWFSMLDGGWPSVRSALERWLAADPSARPPLAKLRGPAPGV